MELFRPSLELLETRDCPTTGFAAISLANGSLSIFRYDPSVGAAASPLAVNLNASSLVDFLAQMRDNAAPVAADAGQQPGLDLNTISTVAVPDGNGGLRPMTQAEYDATMHAALNADEWEVGVGTFEEHQIAGPVTDPSVIAPSSQWLDGTGEQYQQGSDWGTGGWLCNPSGSPYFFQPGLAVPITPDGYGGYRPMTLQEYSAWLTQAVNNTNSVNQQNQQLQAAGTTNTWSLPSYFPDWTAEGHYGSCYLNNPQYFNGSLHLPNPTAQSAPTPGQTNSGAPLNGTLPVLAVGLTPSASPILAQIQQLISQGNLAGAANSLAQAEQALASNAAGIANLQGQIAQSLSTIEQAQAVINAADSTAEAITQAQQTIATAEQTIINLHQTIGEAEQAAQAVQSLQQQIQALGSQIQALNQANQADVQAINAIEQAISEVESAIPRPPTGGGGGAGGGGSFTTPPLLMIIIGPTDQFTLPFLDLHYNALDFEA